MQLALLRTYVRHISKLTNLFSNLINEIATITINKTYFTNHNWHIIELSLREHRYIEKEERSIMNDNTLVSPLYRHPTK